MRTSSLFCDESLVIYMPKSSGENVSVDIIEVEESPDWLVDVEDEFCCFRSLVLYLVGTPGIGLAKLESNWSLIFIE